MSKPHGPDPPANLSKKRLKPAKLSAVRDFRTSTASPTGRGASIPARARDAFSRTARWAEAIYAALPSIEGLRWFSRQFDGAQSFLFFGDRLKGLLRVAEDLGGCFAGLARTKIEWIASAAEITITEP